VCNLRYQRIVGVGVCQHGADGKKHYSMSVDCSQVSHDQDTKSKIRDCLQGRSMSVGTVPFEMVNAGLHWSLRMSKQMLPFELMFGW
jgi:hypothetical protein